MAVNGLRRGEIKIEGLGKRYLFRSAGDPGAVDDSSSEDPEVIEDAEDSGDERRFSLFARPRSEVWALRNLSCHIEPGERVAIVGSNGSGKSTLIKILSRILPPSEGTVTGAGRLMPFPALRKLLSPDMTGCENLRLLGRLVGIPPDHLEERLPEIVEFSEVGEVAYEKASRISPGSLIRLTMAMGLFSEADIYLIDDDLKVSDQAYRLKFERRFAEILQGNVTVIFASNNLGQLRSYCRRALWLERGQLASEGEISSIIQSYLSKVREAEAGVGPKPPALEIDVDPDLVERITSWVKRRLEMLQDRKGVLLEFGAYANVAREQVKLNRDMTDEEIRAAMLQYRASERTAETELMRVEKILERLIIGDGAVQDQHEDTIKAREHVRSRLAAYVNDTKTPGTEGTVAHSGQADGNDVEPSSARRSVQKLAPIPG